MATSVGSGCAAILIVEDDRDTRETLRDVLELEGYEVEVASDGRAALEVLATMGTPCLILLDLMMPVMNGPEFLATLRAEHTAGEIPVVIVSAYADVARTLDAQGYLKKPVDLPDLLAYAERYCSGQPARPAS